MDISVLLGLDHVLLARIQFAFVVAFHIIFPSFTIGLASWLVVVEGLWLKTKKPVYKEIYQLWSKIFAVTFGMGVVSGVVMSYQFGTNWSVFSDKVANVIGPLFGYEVLTAFFLEASFLGIMIFGWGRVGPRMHFASTLIVAIGTLLSAFWILAANSWMQTPTGHTITPDGRFMPDAWLSVIFNPSFPYRFTHMTIASYLTTAFVVSGVGAWYLWRKKYQQHARIMLGMAMIMAIFVTPIQIFVGDSHGLNTLKYQPVKIAAIEGIWDTQEGAPLHLFGIPDEKTETTNYSIEIPKLASLILTHNIDGEIKGLKNWPADERPPVIPVFFSFRVMVGMGLLMLVTGITAVILYFRKRLFVSRLFQLWCMLMTPIGFIAVLAGWFVTEIGRQPYTVYGLLRTVDSISPVAPGPIAFSLALFVIVYFFIFGAGVYYILHLVRKGPKTTVPEIAYGAHGVKKPVILGQQE